jgi:hypothetical protein
MRSESPAHRATGAALLLLEGMVGRHGLEPWTR